MTPNEESRDQRTEVLAAAHAVAAWARARRATWTHAPLPPVVRQPRPEPAAPAPSLGSRAAEWAQTAAHTAAQSAAHVQEAAQSAVQSAVQSAAHVQETAQSAVQSVAHTAVEAAQTAVETAQTAVETAVPPVTRWLARLAAAAAIVAIVLAAVRYLPAMFGSIKTRVETVEPLTPAAAPSAARATTGALRVTSTPPGARVVIDGAPRGETPLTIDTLAPGRHTVLLESPGGSIQRSITVTAGQTAHVDESIFSGWLAVYSPFEVVITEGRRVLRPDDRNQLMLPAGPHDLHFSNRALEYEETRRVDVKPGENATLSITPPRSTITVTSSEPAEVWIDGARAGDTPIREVPADLGTHDIVLRRANGDQRRFTITVTTKPFSLNVDFSKPGL